MTSRSTRWEVDVPIHHSTDPTRRGLHVFTGPARDSEDAVAAAQAVVAVAATTATDKKLDGWTALGLRPGWVLDWDDAHADVWFQPQSLL